MIKSVQFGTDKRSDMYVPERAGDGGNEKEADRHENEAHLHPLRPSVM